MIYNYGKHFIDSEDIKSVLKILKSNNLTQGPIGQIFEKRLNSFFGSKYSSIISNGTSALYLLGKVLDWKKNDIIINSPITFLAGPNSAVYNGSTPDFVDINLNNFTIDLNKLENKIKKFNGVKKVKAVIATDYAGHPCDWEGLRYLKSKYNFTLINDNCHAMGAKLNGSQQYAVKYSDFVILSFHAVKNITTGEGGAILTNRKKENEKIKLLSSHGLIRNFSNQKKLKYDGYYEMVDLGYNLRLSDIQSALGITQIKKLSKFVKKRNEIAKMYFDFLGNCEKILLPKSSNNIYHGYHLYPCQIDFEKNKINKKDFFKKMLKNKIKLQVHYIPVHLQPFYKKKFGFKIGDFKNAEKFFSNEISLPIYYSLKKNEVKYISEKIIECLK